MLTLDIRIIEVEGEEIVYTDDNGNPIETDLAMDYANPTRDEIVTLEGDNAVQLGEELFELITMEGVGQTDGRAFYNPDGTDMDYRTGIRTERSAHINGDLSPVQDAAVTYACAKLSTVTTWRPHVFDGTCKWNTIDPAREAALLG